MGVAVIPYSECGHKKMKYMFACSHDAFLLTDATETSTIYYNDSMPYERVNFSLLHELCHYWLKHQEHSRLSELEANFMTGYLQAPPLFIELVSPISVPTLASLCQISEEAARHRIERHEKWRKHLLRNQMGLAPHEKRLLALLVKQA